MSPRPALVTGLAGAFLLSLAACSGGGGDASASGSAAPSSAASSSAAPSSSGTATTPAMAAPDPKDFPGMDEKTEDGAKQAYRYFIRTYLYMRVTGDSAPLEAMATDDCEWCTEVATNVKESGPPWRSFDITDQAIDLDPIKSNRTVIFYDFSISVESRGSTTEKERSEDREPQDLRVASNLRWAESQWNVESVDSEVRD